MEGERGEFFVKTRCLDRHRVELAIETVLDDTDNETQEEEKTIVSAPFVSHHSFAELPTVN